MPTLDEVTAIVDEALALGGRGRYFGHATPLLGTLPEFDSMAVVSLVTAMEERFGIAIDDDDLTAETFETVGSLLVFVQHKCSA